MSQKQHDDKHGHDHHHDGPCRCQGKCPGCPRRGQAGQEGGQSPK